MKNTTPALDKSQVTAIVLAGGRAIRMGGVDKGLIELSRRPMIEHVLDRLRPQLSAIVISANRNLDTYRKYGWPVVTDAGNDYLGPLAGMVSGMEAATTPYVLTVPCDAPRLPDDLLARMHDKLRTENADIAVAHDGLQAQRAFLLMSRDLRPRIREYLDQGGRSVERWLERQRVTEVDFSDRPGAFVNVNTPADAVSVHTS